MVLVQAPAVVLCRTFILEINVVAMAQEKLASVSVSPSKRKGASRLRKSSGNAAASRLPPGVRHRCEDSTNPAKKP